MLLLSHEWVVSSSRHGRCRKSEIIPPWSVHVHFRTRTNHPWHQCTCSEGPSPVRVPIRPEQCPQMFALLLDIVYWTSLHRFLIHFYFPNCISRKPWKRKYPEEAIPTILYPNQAQHLEKEASTAFKKREQKRVSTNLSSQGKWSTGWQGLNLDYVYSLHATRMFASSRTHNSYTYMYLDCKCPQGSYAPGFPGISSLEKMCPLENPPWNVLDFFGDPWNILCSYNMGDFPSGIKTTGKSWKIV
jgi:hypothetical protein